MGAPSKDMKPCIIRISGNEIEKTLIVEVDAGNMHPMVVIEALEKIILSITDRLKKGDTTIN